MWSTTAILAVGGLTLCLWPWLLRGWRNKNGAEKKLLTTINALSDSEVDERLGFEAPYVAQPFVGMVLHPPYVTELGRVIGYLAGPETFYTLMIADKETVAFVDSVTAQEMHRLRSLRHAMLFERESSHLRRRLPRARGRAAGHSAI